MCIEDQTVYLESTMLSIQVVGLPQEEKEEVFLEVQAMKLARLSLFV